MTPDIRLAIGVVGLLLSLLALADAARRLARRAWGSDDLLAATGGAVFFATGLVMIMEFLGLLALLQARWVFAGAGLTWIGVAVLDRLRPGWREAAAPERRWRPGRRWWPVLAAVTVLALLIAATHLNAMYSPHQRFDSLAGHLPVAVQWLQHGDIRSVPWIAPLQVQAQYPGNAELLDLWLFIPLRHDFLLSLATVPGLLMVVGGVALTARELGARPVAVLASALVLPATTFSLSVLLGTNMQDMLMLGCVGAMAGFAARELHEARWINVVTAGLAAGLAAGSRYAALAVVPLVVIVLLLPQLRRGLRRAMVVAGVLLAAALLTGGYWYLRNLLQTGDPVYPGSIPGHPVNVVETMFFPYLRSYAQLGFAPQLWVQPLDGAVRTYGPVWVGFVLSAPLFPLVALLHRRRPGLSWAWVCLPVITFAAFLVQIGSAGGDLTGAGINPSLQVTQLRYLFPTVCLVIPVLAAETAYLGERVEYVTWTAIVTVAAAAAVVQVGGTIPPVVWIGGAATVLSIGALLAAPRRRLVLGAASITGIVVLAMIAPLQAAHYDRARATSLPYGDAAARLRPMDTSVAVAGFCRVYALYGPDWSRRVQYLTGADDGLDRPLAATYEAWLASLRRNQVTALVVSVDNCYRDVVVAQKQWAAEHPEVFTRVYSADPTQIYWVEPQRQ